MHRFKKLLRTFQNLFLYYLKNSSARYDKKQHSIGNILARRKLYGETLPFPVIRLPKNRFPLLVAELVVFPLLLHT